MNNKKDEFLLQILIGEIKYHIEYAKKAYLDYLLIRKQLSNPKFIQECFEKGTTPPEAGEAFRHLHAFINHSILICNLLSPIDRNPECAKNQKERERIELANKRKHARKRLLKRYIKKGRSLDPLRAIRNRFEHFDEDLDEWIDTTKLTIFMTRNIFDGTSLDKAIKVGDKPGEKMIKESKPFFYLENNTLKWGSKSWELSKAFETLMQLEQEIIQLETKLRERLI